MGGICFKLWVKPYESLVWEKGETNGWTDQGKLALYEFKGSSGWVQGLATGSML